MDMGKVRPQILCAILCGTLFSIVAIYVGAQMEAVEVVTAVIGGFLDSLVV